MTPAWALLVDLLPWFSLAFKSALAFVGIGVFTVLFNPGFTELQMKLIAVVFCLIFTGIGFMLEIIYGENTL